MNMTLPLSPADTLPVATETSSSLLAQTADPVVSASSNRKDVIVVDSRVEGWQALVAKLPPSAEVVVLDSHQNGLQQIADYLSAHGPVDGLHVLSHGWEGDLWIGNTYLDKAGLEQNAALLKEIGQGLKSGGDIMLYACDVAKGEDGLAFVDTLANLTGADVAASTNRTGAGGDWTLEVQQGAIEASTPFAADAMAQYQSSLATLTVTTNADSGVGSLRAQIAAASSGDTITFDAGMTVTLTSGELVISKDLTIDGDVDNNESPRVWWRLSLLRR